MLSTTRARASACTPSLNSVMLTFVMVGIVGTWVSMAELIQGLQDGWSKPFFITYVIHSGYALNLIFYGLIKRYRHARTKASVAAVAAAGGASSRNCKLPTAFAKAAFLLQLLAAGVAITWYISLPLTTVAGNNAVYQSSSAFVFLLSLVFLPAERSRLPLKVLATTLSLAGVMLVTFAPEEEGSGSSSSGGGTVPGYLWVLLSTVSYAGYEVAYAKLVGSHAKVEGPSTAARAQQQPPLAGNGNRGHEEESARSLMDRLRECLRAADSSAESVGNSIHQPLIPGQAAAVGPRVPSTSTGHEAQDHQQPVPAQVQGTSIPWWLWPYVANQHGVEPPLMEEPSAIVDNSSVHSDKSEAALPRVRTWWGWLVRPGSAASAPIEQRRRRRHSQRGSAALASFASHHRPSTAGHLGDHNHQQLLHDDTDSDVASTADPPPSMPAISPVAVGLDGPAGDELLIAGSVHGDYTTTANGDADDASGGQPLVPDAASGVDPLQQAESAALVLGLMGCFTLVTLAAVIPVLHATGLETFELPPGDKARMLMLNTGLDSVYNMCLLLGIGLSSPLTMSIASMLVVPASILADWMLHSDVPLPMEAGGMALILAGFVTLQLPHCRRGKNT